MNKLSKDESNTIDMMASIESSYMKYEKAVNGLSSKVSNILKKEVLIEIRNDEGYGIVILDVKNATTYCFNIYHYKYIVKHNKISEDFAL